MANEKKTSLLEFFALELSEEERRENPFTKRPKGYYSQTVRRNSTGPDAKKPEKYSSKTDKVSKEKPWKVEHCGHCDEDINESPWEIKPIRPPTRDEFEKHYDTTTDPMTVDGDAMAAARGACLGCKQPVGDDPEHTGYCPDCRGRNKYFDFLDASGPDEGVVREAEQLKAAHAEGDSKWSDPFAGRERMPHEEPHSEPQEKSANAWKDQRPCQKLKDFFGGEPFPKHKGKVDEAEKPKPGDVIKGQAKADLPDELPDDGDDFDWDELHKSVSDEEERMRSAPPPPPGEKEPWDDVTPDQIAKQTVKAPPPGAPKQRSVWKLGQEVPPAAPQQELEPEPSRAGIRPPSDEDMTWDEFRAVQPDQAADLERETTPEELQGGSFQKREDGRMYFIAASGKRWGYLGARYGWEEMDFDGETPDGGV